MVTTPEWQSLNINYKITTTYTLKCLHIFLRDLKLEKHLIKI